MTDCELLEYYLKDGNWHNASDIHAALKPGSQGWRLGARIWDLIHKKGLNIVSRIGKNGMAEYRLVKEEKPEYVFSPEGQGNFWG